MSITGNTENIPQMATLCTISIPLCTLGTISIPCMYKSDTCNRTESV